MNDNQTAEYSLLQLDSITFVGAEGGGSSSTDPSITGSAIEITNRSATLVGYATSIRDNLANDLRLGFIYCLEGIPNKDNGIKVTVSKDDIADDGRYTAMISDLLSGVTYKFRSFVYQNGLWFYGKVQSFVTEETDISFVSGEASDITCFSAKVSGGVDVQSDYSSLVKGICYGTGIEPTTSDNIQTASSNTFALQLRQLKGGTIYYYRPYAIVDGQTYYGTVHTFRTLDDNVVETGTIDEETLTVTSHLTLGDGAYSTLTLGVCYGPADSPSVKDFIVTSDEVDEENNYTVQLDNPGCATIYYRAYLLIDGIPHYGTVRNLTIPDVCSQIEKDAECSLFYEALKATSLYAMLEQSPFDDSWDYSRYQSREGIYELPSNSLYCYLPKTREKGFTVMACTNEALDSRYGIHNLQDFYDFALSVYGGNSADDALRTMLSYCIIDRKTTLKRLTTYCSIDTLVSQPTEWYSTLLPHSLLKVTRSMGNTFLNKFGNESGICISEPHNKNICNNGSYYLAFGLPLYNEEYKSSFAAERMRMDFYTLVPELENALMRATNCYYIPSDYLHSISASTGTYIVYESNRDVSPLYEGDGIWLCGLYDATIKLPSVPKRGTYEIRIGYTSMNGSGLAQIYWGSSPERLAAMGIPMDFRIGGYDVGYEPDSDDEINNAEIDKRLRNNGFMKGPASIYVTNEPGQRVSFRNNPNTVRRIIIREAMEADTQYYLRFKSVMNGNNPICLDYIEFVHKDVYDNADSPEDIY